MKKKNYLLLASFLFCVSLTSCVFDNANDQTSVKVVNGVDGKDGKNGVDGKTPYIGTNGNWWIGEIDTKVKAQGENGKDGVNGIDGKDGKNGTDGIDGKDGKTPYIGTNGNWWIGEIDTKVKAQGNSGTDGRNGIDGTDGATWLTGDKVPASSIGKINDFYLNTSTWDVYKKATSSSWTIVGNIKGKDGLNGTNGANGTAGENGKDGKNGIDGIDGATWIVGIGTPTIAIGANGDLYLETKTFNIYLKKENAWEILGNIKGEDSIHANEVLNVKFDVNGGTMPEGYLSSISVDYGSVLDLPIPTRKDYAFGGWWTGFTSNDGQYTTVTPVMNNITLYAKWNINKSYTIHFECNGGNPISDMKYYADEKIECLIEPSKYDYSFSGWYYDKSLTKNVAYPLTLTSDITLYASWSVATYKLTYQTNGGNEIDDVYATAGTEIELPIPNKSNYVFDGWYKDSSLKIKANEKIELHNSQTLYAKWIDETFEVSFASDHGSFIEKRQFISGTVINELPTPVRDDYIFNGWYNDSSYKNKVQYPFKITADMTVYAKWTANFIGISSLYDLNRISNMNQNYRLLNDIDCTNSTINSIGTKTSPFKGSFNGNGHFIKNARLDFEYDGEEALGLFNYNDGIIKNVKFTNANVSLDEKSTAKTFYKLEYFGTLVGVNNGTIENCSLNANIDIKNKNYFSSNTLIVGGICGYNASHITNTMFNGNIHYKSESLILNYYIGLVCGKSEKNSLINKCISSGNISSDKNGKAGSSDFNVTHHIGGICGYNDASISQTLFLAGTFTLLQTNKYTALKDSSVSGKTDSNSKLTRVYRGGNVSTKDLSTISTYNLDSKSWYLNPINLGLSEDIWDLDNLDYDNYIYPSLK